MAKRKTFEDLLNTKIRWPAQGDKPFVVAESPLDNAKVAENRYVRLGRMIEGYKFAADLMVHRAEAEPPTRDTLVYPIIFNYRQFLELSLKYQLSKFGLEVGIEPNWKTHDLAVLWSEFLAILEQYGTQDPDETDPVVQSIILEFAKIDPGSYSYRYPMDRQGNPVPVEYPDLHLPTLADVMQAVAGYFSGCDGYLSDLNNAQA